MADIYSPLLNQLIEAFQCLPGVGAKTAQRMAFHLLDKDRDAGGRLAATLERAVRSIRNCERCRMLTEEAVCRFCGSDKRDRSQLCIVETPADLLAIEQSGAYRGAYFVLMGHLSPIDGIGPAELGLELLEPACRHRCTRARPQRAHRTQYGWRATRACAPGPRPDAPWRHPLR